MSFLGNSHGGPDADNNLQLAEALRTTLCPCRPLGSEVGMSLWPFHIKWPLANMESVQIKLDVPVFTWLGHCWQGFSFLNTGSLAATWDENLPRRNQLEWKLLALDRGLELYVFLFGQGGLVCGQPGRIKRQWCGCGHFRVDGGLDNCLGFRA